MSYHACSRDDEPEHTIFLVGQDDRGQHRVCENHGAVGGVFISRAEAIVFANHECSKVRGAIVLVMPTLLESHHHVA